MHQCYSKMDKKIPNIFEKVGNTPLVSMKLENFPNIQLYIKLESYNPTGSVKDRAASYILNRLIKCNLIDKNTTIIESSSGNFGVALAAFCKYYGLKFIAVIDPHISPMNEMLIKSYGASTVKVSQPDDFGGYLLSRIKKVKELLTENDNSYWVNQYENPLNAQAYYQSLGKEICYQIEEIDYIFLGVSSGGTIAGVSQKVKENFPNVKVVAVDVEGSAIFGNEGKKRCIPGIGSSMIPKILDEAFIDDRIIVNEVCTIKACYELLESHTYFVGGSSGSVFSGIKQYFEGLKIEKPLNVVTIFADRGERYYNTIYNTDWCKKVMLINKEEQKEIEKVLNNNSIKI